MKFYEEKEKQQEKTYFSLTRQKLIKENKMVKIIEITNYHQFDGILLTKEEFVKLLEVLEFGTMHFRAKVEEDGKVSIYTSK